MRKQRETALPQVKSMLGEAAAHQNSHGGVSRRARFATSPVRGRLLAALGVVSVAAVGAVGAGALNRAPVAPELSPAQSGVKADAIPGESKAIQTPEGTVEESVSPCIKSDPAGYSAAELEDTEWCFHAPGQAASAAQAKAGGQPQGTVVTRTSNGGVRVLGQRK